MKFKKYFTSYKLLLFMSSILAGLIVELIAVQTITKQFENSSRDMSSSIQRLQINETKEKLTKIKEIQRKNQFPMYTAAEARVWLLEVLEEFHRLYSARIVDSVTDEKSAYTAEIRFKYVPDSPEDLLSMLNYFRSSVSPLFSISEATFKKVQDKKEIDLTIKITQPYMGGDYVY